MKQLRLLERGGWHSAVIIRLITCPRNPRIKGEYYSCPSIFLGMASANANDRKVEFQQAMI